MILYYYYMPSYYILCYYMPMGGAVECYLFACRKRMRYTICPMEMQQLMNWA